MQNLRRLHHLAVCLEHNRVSQTLTDELQIHQSIVDLLEGRSGKYDQVDLHSSGCEVFV